MTKKRKHPVEGQFQNAEVWRPKRAMGLARALNKAGWGTRRQTVELVEFMAVKRYSHIMHITSTVTGHLRDGARLWLRYAELHLGCL